MCPRLISVSSPPPGDLYWFTHWDGDGQGFGIGHALSADVLRSDRANPRNIKAFYRFEAPLP